MTSNNKNSKVIITADDFGITQGVNKAIQELAEAGRLTSTSVMSNMPYYEEVVDLKDKIGIGIHLNLTTGTPVNPLENVRSLVNENGEFWSLPELISRIKRKQLIRSEVELELDAQTKRLHDIGITPDHVDSHSSICKYPFLTAIAIKIARKYGVKAARTFTPRKFDYNRLLSPRSSLISLFLIYQKHRWKKNGFTVADRKDSLLKSGLDYEYAIKYLVNVFSNLPDGIMEFTIHPGYCIGNEPMLEDYVNEREVELKAMLSNEFGEIIDTRRVDLISFKDI